MNVKNAIKFALAGAVALASSSAFALTPAVVQGLGAGNVIYVAGSTATDNALKAWAKLNPSVDPNAPFTTGSYDLYTTATGYVLTGTAGPIFGSLSGTNIAIVKQTQGGSALGIHNVAENLTAAGFSDLANMNTATNAPAGAGNTNCVYPAGTADNSGNASPSNTAASGAFQAFNTYVCQQPELSLVPNAGISDEDPTTWIGSGPAGGAVTAADAGELTATNGVQVPFAIIVSAQLRNALQTAEGLTSGSDTLANVPSMTLSQVRAILSQQVTSAAKINAFNPTTGAVTAVVASTNGSFIHVCRRGDTSGSQLAANIFMFGKGCSKGNGVSNVVVPDDSGAQSAGVAWTAAPADDADGFLDLGELVFAGAGTGDVTKCVGAPTDNAANGDAGGGDSDTGGVDTFNARIGFASTDQVPTAAPLGNDASGNVQGWRYVKLDGQLPSVWNIEVGQYDWITEDTFNSPTGTSPNTTFTTGNRSAIWSTVKANFANINSVAGLNGATKNAGAPADATGAADTGLLAIGSATVPSVSPSSANGFPLAIRFGNSPFVGPYSYVTKYYTAPNNCNAPYTINP